MQNFQNRGGTRLLLTLAAGLAVSFACFLFYDALLGDLPVMTEAREYVSQRGFQEGIGPTETLARLAEPSGRNSRPTSMLFFRLIASVCGFERGCINATQIGLISLGAALLLLHLVQIGVALVPSIASATLWCFCWPTLDALSWQATSHSKLCFVLVFALLIAARGLRRCRSGLQLLAVNVLLAVLTVLALQAKETAFCLVVMLPAQVLLGRPEPERLWARLRHLVLAITAAMTFVVVYLLRVPPGWSRHTTDGDPIGNAAAYVRFLLNTGERAPFLVLLLMGGLALAFAYLWRAHGQPRAPDQPRRVLASPTFYLGLFFVTSALPASRTQHAEPYHMLMPAAAFFALLAQLIHTDLRLVQRARWACTMALFAALLSAFSWCVLSSPSVAAMRASGAAVDQAFATIRRVVPNDPHAVYYFVVPDANARLTHRLFDQRDSSKDGLLDFVFEERAGGDLIYAASPVPPDERDPGVYYVRFDEAFELVDITRGDRTLWSRSRGQ